MKYRNFFNSTQVRPAYGVVFCSYPPSSSCFTLIEIVDLRLSRRHLLQLLHVQLPAPLVDNLSDKLPPN